MFVRIPLDRSSLNTKEGQQLLQDIVSTVSEIVHTYDGTVNKFLFDDKGHTFLIAFGAHGKAHRDDAVR